MKPSIVILTGAGISAESGLPTFRDADGLWEGHAVEDVATPEAFERDPKLVQQFYNMRRAALDTVEPNVATIGSSGQVYPAAGFVMTARFVGAKTVEINTVATTISTHFDEQRVGLASVEVPRWVDELLCM